MQSGAAYYNDRTLGDNLLGQAELNEHADRLRHEDQGNWGPHADVVCRFCRQDAHYDAEIEIGAAVCQCQTPFSYAHRVCLYEHVFRTGALACPTCRTDWRLDYPRLAASASLGGRVRTLRGFRWLATGMIAFLAFLATTVLWALILKELVGTATGTPEYEVFGVGALRVKAAWCLGDLVVGSLATLASLLLVVVAVVVRRRLRRYTGYAGDEELELTDFDTERQRYRRRKRTRRGGGPKDLEAARAEAEAELLQASAKNGRHSSSSSSAPAAHALQRAANSVILKSDADADEDDGAFDDLGNLAHSSDGETHADLSFLDSVDTDRGNPF